jgi:hypothetical protein
MPNDFLKQNSRGATPMPRPKSEITDDSKHVGIRLTSAHYNEWKRLGGAMWLRRELSKSIQHENKKETDITKDIESRRVA